MAGKKKAKVGPTYNPVPGTLRKMAERKADRSVSGGSTVKTPNAGGPVVGAAGGKSGSGMRDRMSTILSDLLGG